MAIALLVLAVVWMLLAWGCQRQVVFPRRFLPPTPAEVGRLVEVLGGEVMTLETEAGPVEAFFHPGHGVSPREPGPAVVFAHGNGETIDVWFGALETYREMGVSVLLPEFRGYGRSAGRPSEAAIVADFERFHDLLAAREDVDSERIVYHGRSLGGAVAAVLTERRPPAALILESTFTSTAAMARRYLVPGFLIRDPLRAREAVERYDGPVLVMHGRQDTIVPPGHGEALAEAAGVQVVWLEMGHNDPPPREPYWAAIEAFLEEAGVVPASSELVR
ncbi:MAG: alpha/beta hydrolase [Phycisphaeraceae bacterium]